MSLEKLRRNIDKIDSLLLKILAKRNKLAKEIGKIKKQKNLPISNKAREEEVFARIASEAKIVGLDSRIAKEIYKLIIMQAKEVQK